MVLSSAQPDHRSDSKCPSDYDESGQVTAKLLRNTKSEQNLSHWSTEQPSTSSAKSVSSDSSDEGGDLLPDEEYDLLSATKILMRLDPVVALGRLGQPIAKSHGLDSAKFVADLMAVFTSSVSDVAGINPRAKRQTYHVLREQSHSSPTQQTRRLSDCSPTRRRSSTTGSKWTDSQSRRRHFSFEPGDDRMRNFSLGRDPAYDKLAQESRLPIESQTLESQTDHGLTHTISRVYVSTQSPHGSSTDIHRPSKIPSPMHTTGRVRRERSTSSFASTFRYSDVARQNSTSSILTAFRNAASRNPRTTGNDCSNVAIDCSSSRVTSDSELSTPSIGNSLDGGHRAERQRALRAHNDATSSMDNESLEPRCLL